MQFDTKRRENLFEWVMRAIYFLFLVFIGFGLRAQGVDSNNRQNGNLLTNKVRLSSLNGVSLNFYLNHRGIDGIAKKFYKGEGDIKNQQVLNTISDSLISCNSEVRPFYFFLFNRIVDISDGPFDERIALRCKEYIEKYPCDFFSSFNQPELNINVVKWTMLIGSNLKDKGSFATYRGGVDAKLRSSCPDVQDLLRSFMMEVRMCLVR